MNMTKVMKAVAYHQSKGTIPPTQKGEQLTRDEINLTDAAIKFHDLHYLEQNLNTVKKQENHDQPPVDEARRKVIKKTHRGCVGFQYRHFLNPNRTY